MNKYYWTKTNLHNTTIRTLYIHDRIICKFKNHPWPPQWDYALDAIVEEMNRMDDEYKRKLARIGTFEDETL